MTSNSRRHNQISNELKEKFINYASSTRRIFHISIDKSLKENENFKDIYFSDWGTGILLKNGMKFFLLTAKHVLKYYLNELIPNTSPFRVTSLSNGSFSTTLDFLYPKRAWEIGKIMQDHPYYDFEDVILIELFNPLPGQKIGNYIDLNTIEYLQMEDYKEGMLLTDAGYSELSNPYNYEPEDTKLAFDANVFTSSTTQKLDLVHGILKKNQYTYFFEKTSYIGVKTNGMSGGLIIGIDRNGDSKLVGMHGFGNETSNYINFLPICEITKAIKKYLNAESIEIDYCHFERLRNQQTDIGGIRNLFEQYKANYPEIPFRSQKSTEYLAYFDDLCDFVVTNKEMLLVNALDLDQVKKTKHNYKIMLKFIINMTICRNLRIQSGRP